MPGPALHLIRPVVIAIAAVTAIFLVALWLSHAHTREIGSRAAAIAERADSEHAVENAHEIERVRSEARDLALVLGGLGIAVGFGAGAVTLSVIRRRARLVAEHQALVDARAAELEAFAGRIAHDLRNPLGAIALRIQTLRLRETTDPVAVDKLAENAVRMDHLIEDLLEFARSGAAPDPGARASLRATVEQVLADARLQAERAGAELLVDDIPDVEVVCARGTLASVLANLVDNSMKYVTDGTGPRRICMRATARASRVRVEVADTGPGLPPGTESLVFEPFRRVGNLTQRGLGLGLATVKRIVEAYGGRVGVSSAPGRGSTFWFELLTTA